jgi:hypothetical protein
MNQFAVKRAVGLQAVPGYCFVMNVTMLKFYISDTFNMNLQMLRKFTACYNQEEAQPLFTSYSAIVKLS